MLLLFLKNLLLKPFTYDSSFKGVCPENPFRHSFCIGAIAVYDMWILVRYLFVGCAPILAPFVGTGTKKPEKHND